MKLPFRPRFLARLAVPCASASLAVLAGTGGAAPGAPAGATPSPEGRAIVLGFDGADHRIARELMDAGRMPNLARLAAQGSVAPLTSTILPESASSWSAINTGLDASHNNVPGFVTRELVGGQPFPAMGYQGREDRLVVDLDAGFPIGLLAGRDPLRVAILAGLAVLLAFLFTLKVLLRLRWLLALPLALILGGVGAYGARAAAGYVPTTVHGIVTNPIRGQAFWEVAARAGVPSVVLDAAMSWDRPHVAGARVLSGLGVPDARGETGSWFLYTTDEDEFDRPPKGRSRSPAGTIFRVDWDAERIETALFGPVNFCVLDGLDARLARIEGALQDTSIGWKESQELRGQRDELRERRRTAENERVTAPLVIERLGPDRARVTVAGSAQELRVGDWSDWYHISFELNALVRAQAITRVKLLELEGDLLKLYVNRLDIDPANPPFWQPISQPRDFAAWLAREAGGPYETYGWACATMPFKAKVIDPVTLLEDIEFTMAWRERLARTLLRQDDWRLLFAVFSTPDRVQHMMFQYYDPGHPLYDAQEANREVEFFGRRVRLADAIPVIYEQLDRIIGWVADEFVGPRDLLLICADHGFQSFRHQFDVNAWLVTHGFMALQDGIGTGGQTLTYVDWSRTKAYSLGLGAIYLNLQGRERSGIVSAADRASVIAELRAALLATTDPRTGEPVVKQVHVVADLHDGPYIDREGDLQLGLAATYRIAWDSTLGSIGLEQDEGGAVVPQSFVRPNLDPWSGDHVSVAQDEVLGLFASNRPVEIPQGGVHVLHLAPTVLAALGAPVPPELPRPALLFSRVP